MTTKALILSLPLLFAGCVNDLEEVKQVTSMKTASLETGEDVEILYSNQGKVTYKVVGSKLIRHALADPYTEFPDDVTVYFYDDSSQVDSWLTADYGKSWERRGHMVVRYNVVLQNNEGEKLETEELIWDEKEGKIWSEKFTTITTPKEVIYGDGFEADEDFTNYRIKKIRGTFQVDDTQTETEEQ
jgi:LPS export ABC transporter protein LptC